METPKCKMSKVRGWADRPHLWLAARVHGSCRNGRSESETQKQGYLFWGVPTISAIISWGLYWGPRPASSAGELSCQVFSSTSTVETSLQRGARYSTSWPCANKGWELSGYYTIEGLGNGKEYVNFCITPVFCGAGFRLLAVHPSWPNQRLSSSDDFRVRLQLLPAESL